MSILPKAESAPDLTSVAVPLPGHPGFHCSELNPALAEQLITRTLDSDDVRLREMTGDLKRFPSASELETWRPGRDLLCLVDTAGSLVAFGWIADKPLPARDDYFDPELMRECAPQLTSALRTYGVARGRGALTRDFALYARELILRKRSQESAPIWYEAKVGNVWARALARQTGYVEVSGEAGGTVVGVYFGD